MSHHNELLASHRVLSMLESACEHSEQVLDGIPSVFAVINADNRVIRANHAFCQAVGVSLTEALHLDFSSYFSSEHRAILLHHFQQARDPAAPHAPTRVKLELQPHRADLPSKPFFWRIFKVDHLSQAEGPVISVLGEDLSLLYRSELKLTSIFASLPLGLMVLDPQGRITEVLSEYAHALLQRSALQGLPLRHAFEASNPDLAQELAQAFDALRLGSGQSLAEFAALDVRLAKLSRLRVQHGNGPERWIRPRFQPIAKNERIESYLVILEDITASQMAQRQIEQADLLGRQAQALYECAIRDPLSGLYTRLFMNDSVNPLIASAKRGNIDELAILMLDIDNFKRVNDTHGHDAGDRVIRTIGQVIKSCIRDTDIAVRFGGEEFFLALPSNDSRSQGGTIVAERIRAKLAATPIDLGNGVMLNVTTSCGVAYCNKDDTLLSLTQRADQYLYEAKHSGKNQVCAEPGHTAA